MRRLEIDRIPVTKPEEFPIRGVRLCEALQYTPYIYGLNIMRNTVRKKIAGKAGPLSVDVLMNTTASHFMISDIYDGPRPPKLFYPDPVGLLLRTTVVSGTDVDPLLIPDPNMLEDLDDVAYRAIMSVDPEGVLHARFMRQEDNIRTAIDVSTIKSDAGPDYVDLFLRSRGVFSERVDIRKYPIPSEELGQMRLELLGHSRIHISHIH